MIDPTTTLALAGIALAALGLTGHLLLKGWRDWLDLRRLEVAGRDGGGGAPSPGSRIELADLKERVRKLEGIAAGVDL